MTDENEQPELKSERVQLLMTPSELKAIDDWSFEKKIRTRAEAIRQLSAMGMFTEKLLESTAQLAQLMNKINANENYEVGKFISAVRDMQINLLEVAIMASEAELKLPDRINNFIRVMMDTIQKEMAIERAILPKE